LLFSIYEVDPLAYPMRQISFETIGHTQYNATGGQADFVRGALAAKKGKSFIALKSTSLKKDGTLTSRIVLNFTPGPW